MSNLILWQLDATTYERVHRMGIYPIRKRSPWGQNHARVMGYSYVEPRTNGIDVVGRKSASRRSLQARLGPFSLLQGHPSLVIPAAY
jgi:hypothetical protein